MTYIVQYALWLFVLFIGVIGMSDTHQEIQIESPMPIALFECGKGDAIEYSDLKGIEEFTVQFFMRRRGEIECGTGDIETIFELNKAFTLLYSKKEQCYNGLIEETQKVKFSGTSPKMSESPNWIHWSFRIKNNNLEAFLNGKPISPESELRITKIPEKIFFGSAQNSLFSPFSGELGDIRIWKRALSQAEISDALQKSIHRIPDKESISIIENGMLLFLENSEMSLCIYPEISSRYCKKLKASYFQFTEENKESNSDQLPRRRLAGGCHPSCDSCLAGNNALECTSCNSGDKLVLNVGDTYGECSGSCPTNSLADSSSGVDKCYYCHSSCATCQIAGDATACKTCSPPSYKVITTAGSTYGSCASTCPPNSVGSGSFCYYCHGSCATCEIENDPDSCKTCDPVTNVVVTTSGGTSGTCMSGCPTDTIPSGNFCYKCHDTCKTCTVAGNDQKCVTCFVSGYKVFGTVDGPCISSCPDNSIEGANFCAPCHSTCATCTVAGSATSCTTCETSGYKVKGTTFGNCVSGCPSHYAVDSTGVFCHVCHSDCDDCSEPGDSTKCTSCATTGYVVVGATAGSCQSTPCPSNTIINGAGTHCLPCHTDCLTCNTASNNNFCTSCPAGKLLFGNTYGTCIDSPCPDGYAKTGTDVLKCISCDSTCSTCSEPGDGSKCTSCPSGQKLVGVSSGTCQSSACPTNTIETPDGLKCVPCHSSCSTCSIAQDSESCLSCPVNQYVLGITAGSCVTECPTHYAIDTTVQTHCLICDSHCEKCSIPGDSTKCTTCPSPYLVNGAIYGDCVAYPCPSGKINYPELTRCLACDISCSECSASGDANKCTQCASGLLVGSTEGYCTTTGCPDGTAVNSDNTKCLPCNGDCVTCSAPSDNTKCTSCNAGVLLVGSSVGECVGTCPTGTGPDSSGIHCLACHTSCTKCSLEGDLNKCTACPALHYVLGTIEGKCVSPCPSHYQVDSTGVRCLVCYSLCLECSAPSNHLKCTSCPGTYLIGATEGQCLSYCPTGTALLAPDNTNCLPCDPSCYKCSVPSSSVSCTACISSKRLLDGTCVVAPCPTHYADDSTHKKCELCDGSCYDCSEPTDPSKCTSCYSGSRLLGSSAGSSVGTCVTPPCPSGTVENAAQTKCVYCDTSCLECTEGSNSDKCSSCNFGYILYVTIGPNYGSCIELPCPVHYAANLANTQCQVCNNLCYTCSSPGYDSTCTSCYAGNYIIETYTGSKIGTCSPNCPTKFAANTTSLICESCSDYCAECDTPHNASACLSCIDNYYYRNSSLSESECVSACDDGYGPNLTDKKCYKCDESCLTCSEADSPSSCTSCQAGLVLNTFNNSCMSSCPDGFALNPTTFQCIECDISCATCSVPENPNYCLKCNSNSGVLLKKYLSSVSLLSGKNYNASAGSCSATCPAGSFVDKSSHYSCYGDACPSYLYQNNSHLECVDCDSSCSSCILPSNPSACMSCSNSLYYLLVDTLSFNYTLSTNNGQFTSLRIYGSCTETCNSINIINETEKACYIVNLFKEQFHSEKEAHSGFMTATATDSSMATALGISSAISLLVTGSFSSLLSIVGSVQLLGLYGLINVPGTSSSLTKYYKSLDIPTFEFLPNILTSSLKSSINQTGNHLSGQLCNHPSLHGKSLLPNVGNLVTFYTVVGAFSVVCLLFRKKLDFFNRQAQQLPNLYLSSGILHFTQASLCTFVQLKYMSFSGDTLYSLSSVSAFVALSANVALIIFTTLFVHLVSDTLTRPSIIARFGCLINDYNKENRFAKYTVVGSMVRKLAMPMILVLASDFPTFQIYSILAINVASLGAICIVRPYKSVFTSVNNIVSEVGGVAVIGMFAGINSVTDQETLDTLGHAVIYTMTGLISVLSCVSLAESAMYFVEFVQKCINPGNNYSNPSESTINPVSAD